MPLFENIKPDLIKRINEFSKKYNISLFNKIRKETDQYNLNSLLTEAHFGFWFDSFATALKYNHRYFPGNNSTPDYTITFNSQEIIIEVFRVNPASEDMEEQEAENRMIDKFQLDNPDVPFVGAFHRITVKTEKLAGNNGSIVAKAKKYGPLAELFGTPVLLCVYLDFVSGHDSLNLYQTLYGHGVQFIGDFSFDDYFPGLIYHDLSQALYYNQDQVRKNISGIILRCNNGSFTYFHNFSCDNRLSQVNKEYFLNLQYTPS